MLKRLIAHLKSNQGSEYTEKIIMIAAAFIVGALLVAIIFAALSESYVAGVGEALENIFDI